MIFQSLQSHLLKLSPHLRATYPELPPFETTSNFFLPATAHFWLWIFFLECCSFLHCYLLTHNSGTAQMLPDRRIHFWPSQSRKIKHSFFIPIALECIFQNTYHIIVLVFSLSFWLNWEKKMTFISLEPIPMSSSY